MIDSKFENFVTKELKHRLKDAKILWNDAQGHNSFYVASPDLNTFLFAFNTKRGELEYNQSYFENFFKIFNITNQDEAFYRIIENVVSDSIDQQIFDVHSSRLYDESWFYLLNHYLKNYKIRDFFNRIVEGEDLGKPKNDRFEKLLFNEFDRITRNSEMIKYRGEHYILMEPDEENPIYYLEYDSSDDRSGEDWLWYAPDKFQTIMNVFSLDTDSFESLIKKWFISRFSKNVEVVALGSENDLSSTHRLLKRVLLYNKNSNQ